MSLNCAMPTTVLACQERERSTVTGTQRTGQGTAQGGGEGRGGGNCAPEVVALGDHMTHEDSGEEHLDVLMVTCAAHFYFQGAGRPCSAPASDLDGDDFAAAASRSQGLSYSRRGCTLARWSACFASSSSTLRWSLRGSDATSRKFTRSGDESESSAHP
jgi:hypothetical protein